MEQTQLIKELKALLFVSENPLSLKTLSETLEKNESEIETLLHQLNEFLLSQTPLQITFLAGGYQLCTQKEYSALIYKLLTPQKSKLSRSVMEVLAIIAYQQPVTLSEIEIMRGVQSDYGLRQLLDKGLIQEVGQKKTPGRPVLYATTPLFLHTFNLKSIEDLPTINTQLTNPIVTEQELNIEENKPLSLPAIS